MAYDGSCHCGTVTFTVEGDLPAGAINCNCSHCRRKGLLLSFVPADSFALTGGGDAIVDYLFNRHAITHQFCSTCGTQPFAEGSGPGGAKMRAINLRCVPAADLDSLTLEKVDGAAY